MVDRPSQTCVSTARGVSARLFAFDGSEYVSADDSHVRNGFAGVSFTLGGPGATAEAGHLPVRGDLAHIKLAGHYFVPHYAVPMPHRVTPETVVLRANRNANGAAVETLAAGTVFNVLDMSGGWAWGQVGEDGFVGYLPLDTLEAVG
jgi:Bacterial dipeptidyl-peptidase Sh3 domain